MLKRRIIPCLDVKDGRVVKGVNFLNLRDQGDPVEVAERYNTEGADELVFLDITASHEKRGTMKDLVAQVAERVFLPFTVGGGISDLAAMRELLKLGADKISINSPALREPDLITESALRFGSQCIVVAIDARKEDGIFRVYLNGGRVPTEWDAVDWAVEAERRGAGEILLTSMDADGTGEGYDILLTRAVTDAVAIPVIASGGAGNTRHFVDVFQQTGADAALAATLFHERILEIADLKNILRKEGIPVRPLEN